MALVLLLSLCNAFINGARGSGIKGGKVAIAISMWLSAYIINQSLWSLLFPLPLFLFFWQPGGTGPWIPKIVKALSFLHLGDSTWRFFEVGSVFLYCLISGTIYYIIN